MAVLGAHPGSEVKKTGICRQWAIVVAYLAASLRNLRSWASARALRASLRYLPASGDLA
jgi:hypothetical protein